MTAVRKIIDDYVKCCCSSKIFRGIRDNSAALVVIVPNLNDSDRQFVVQAIYPQLAKHGGVRASRPKIRLVSIKSWPLKQADRYSFQS